MFRSRNANQAAYVTAVVLLQVDYNKDGRLEALEIEIAILKLYNIINKRLPGWQNPPTRPKIQEALKLFDEDGNGTLDKQVRTLSLECSSPHAYAQLSKTSLVSACGHALV